MPTQLDPAFRELLQRRLIATLGTNNADGSVHLTAVWFLAENDFLFIATSQHHRETHSFPDD